MTTTAAHRQRGFLLSLLTLLTLLGATLVSAVDASASTRVATETRVRAIGDPTIALVAARDPGSSTTVGVPSDRLRQLVSATGVATNSGRGLSEFGGVIEQTGTNAAGGRVFTSTGGIAQNDFAGIVESALMRGDEVTILSGAHGAIDGSIAADASMLAADLRRFGSLPGVRVLDVSTMSAAEIQAAMNGSGTIIGGFCNSGACLAALGGG